MHTASICRLLYVMNPCLLSARDARGKRPCSIPYGPPVLHRFFICKTPSPARDREGKGKVCRRRTIWPLARLRRPFSHNPPLHLSFRFPILQPNPCRFLPLSSSRSSIISSSSSKANHTIALASAGAAGGQQQDAVVPCKHPFHFRQNGHLLPSAASRYARLIRHRRQPAASDPFRPDSDPNRSSSSSSD